MNKEDDLLWWRDGIVYQIYPRSFLDTNQNGIGDLIGVIQRLDYLKDLGVDAVWLSPIYLSPDVDFGYDMSDYREIDLRYGTMQDFMNLIEEAHHRGIRIILDLVLNHTADNHPWFQESRKSLDNSYRDWYIWRNSGKGGGSRTIGNPGFVVRAGNMKNKQGNIIYTLSMRSSLI